MDVSFLRCLRLAEGRLRTAVTSQGGRGKALGKLRSNLGVLRPLAEVPLRLPRASKLYLPAQAGPNSKAAAVVRELGEPTLPPGALWYHTGSTDSRWRRSSRLLLRLPSYLPLLVKLQRRGRRLDLISQRALMGWFVRRRLLRRHPAVAPIIISDVSPGLHMLWSAALREGNAVVWWQDDYHHTKPLPQPVAAAVVLNQGGIDAVRATAPAGTPIFARPMVELKEIRRIPEDPVVGVATNASFGRSPSDFQLLDAVRDRLGVTRLRLRLHPNSPLSQDSFRGESVQVAPVGETIAEFARRIDLGVVGNSAVQLKLLCEGLPVVHMAGLDPHRYDTYGYVRMGLITGCKKVTELSVPAVIEFYAAGSADDILRGVVHVPKSKDLLPLSQLGDSLLSRQLSRASRNPTNRVSRWLGGTA